MFTLLTILVKTAGCEFVMGASVNIKIITNYLISDKRACNYCP